MLVTICQQVLNIQTKTKKNKKKKKRKKERKERKNEEQLKPKFKDHSTALL